MPCKCACCGTIRKTRRLSGTGQDGSRAFHHMLSLLFFISVSRGLIGWLTRCRHSMIRVRRMWPMVKRPKSRRGASARSCLCDIRRLFEQIALGPCSTRCLKLTSPRQPRPPFFVHALISHNDCPALARHAGQWRNSRRKVRPYAVFPPISTASPKDRAQFSYQASNPVLPLCPPPLSEIGARKRVPTPSLHQVCIASITYAEHEACIGCAEYERMYAFRPGQPLSCDSVSTPGARRKVGKLFWVSALSTPPPKARAGQVGQQFR